MYPLKAGSLLRIEFPMPEPFTRVVAGGISIVEDMMVTPGGIMIVVPGSGVVIIANGECRLLNAAGRKKAEPYNWFICRRRIPTQSTEIPFRTL